MPPKIATFDFGEDPASFGESASVQCLLLSGDSPVNFEWFFNSKPVYQVSGISTVMLGKKSSAMTIESVNDNHAGNYTCKASNRAYSVNYTAELVVNGKFFVFFAIYINFVLLF